MGESGMAVQLYTKNGQAYFAPPDNEKCINSIKCWDQAFCVYATIFTQANPDRSSEIWQYVHVIHTAAATYNWNNVAFYDFTFRQLMASKPWWSWAKTYTQGWNLALKDLAIRAFNTGSMNGAVMQRQSSVANKPKSWRDNCCWHFNKTDVMKRQVALTIIDVHIAGHGVHMDFIIVGKGLTSAVITMGVETMRKNEEIIGTPAQNSNAELYDL